MIAVSFKRKLKEILIYREKTTFCGRNQSTGLLIQLSINILLIEGSSISKEVIHKVEEVKHYKSRSIMVILDSHHSHDHVLEELRLYSPYIQKGGYLVVFDTVIEDMPKGFFVDKPWDKGNNPKTAVWRFLEENKRFDICHEISAKLSISAALDGYLKCIE